MMLTSAEDISLRNRETNGECLQMKKYQDLPHQCPGPIVINIAVDRDRNSNLTGKKESNQSEKVMKNQLSINKDMNKKCPSILKIIGRLKYDCNANKDMNLSLSQSMNKIKRCWKETFMIYLWWKANMDCKVSLKVQIIS